MYGIDKSEIRNITIDSIDLDKLRASDVVFNVSSSDAAIPIKLHDSDDYIKLDRLYITDNLLFNTFTLDYKKDRGTRAYYSILDLAIAPKYAKKDNRRPLTADEYKQKLNTIKQYLIDRYGIYTDFTDSKIKKIELNITQKMKHPFTAYKLLFEAIKEERNLKTYPCFMPFMKGLEYNTYYFYSKIQHMKLYNKTKELHDSFKIEISDELTRLEYTLIGYDKINAKLGTINPFKLTDSIIAKFLNESITEDVFKPINRYIAKSNKELTKKYKQLKKQYKRGYIREFAHYANSKDALVFDIEQVLEIAKSDIIKNNNRTKNEKIIYSIMSDDFIGNYEKLEEFKRAFHITI